MGSSRRDKIFIEAPLEFDHKSRRDEIKYYFDI